MRRDAGFDAGKPVGLGIEPMEIAVEYAGNRRALHRRQHVDCRKRRQIAVEPSDHIKRFGREIRRARKDARRIAIIVGADPAGCAIRFH